MKLDWIKNCIKSDDYYFSHHADIERMNDNLTILDIEKAILSGRILENYSDDIRGKSCLIVGFNNEGIPIHAVCGERNNKLVIITVYIPTPPKFKTPYTRG